MNLQQQQQPSKKGKFNEIDNEVLKKMMEEENAEYDRLPSILS